jgi:uncharacterized iron-regulated membrane protein
MVERPPGGAVRDKRRRHRVTQWSLQLHLWLGIVVTVALTVIAITGVALNHKRGLGLMPDVPNESTGRLEGTLSLDSLARIGLDAAAPGQNAAVAQIDRMDVRPRDGFVKVRLRDIANSEATVDIHTGKVLHVGPRADVYFEKLHSGEIFGSQGILLSDVAAIALVIVLISGVWLWIAPKLKRGAREEGEALA